MVRTPENYIADLINQGENKTTEFKANIDRDGLLEIIVSFANTDGGKIIIGVDDRKKIVGFYTFESERIEKKIAGYIRSHCEPVIDPRLVWMDLDGKPLLIIHVTEGKDKPYIFKDKGIYIREKEHDFHITRLSLDKIYGKSHISEY